MKALAEYAHAKGMKFGVYTARGSGTCQGRPGSLNHETVDAATYCSWDLDYLKIDGCKGAQDSKTSWSRFHDGFVKCYNETGQFIVQSVESCDSVSGCGGFVSELANLWRTGGDVQATFLSVLSNIKRNNNTAPLARPGHFSDPDMLEIGNPGLSVAEQRTQFTLWCIAGAPLLIGNNLPSATNITLEILSNKDLIMVNQDLGKDNHVQGIQLSSVAVPSTPTGVPTSVWVKWLSTGKIAVVLLNEGTEPAKITVSWSDIGISGRADVYDMWQHKDLGNFASSFSATVQSHDTSAILVTVV
eukprot:m.251709 g.251709  ORF g.251709 m.251709 type:complete len:301 (+) comp26698_c1_seq1:340-1242(+)